MQIAIDCADPERLVAFWCLALDYEPAPPPDGAATWRAWYLSVGVPEAELGDGDCVDRIRDPLGVGPPIWFQPVPEAKTVKNRVHLDVQVGGGRSVLVEHRQVVVRARVAQLLAAGGIVLRELSEVEGHFGVTMRDPEGNELCIT